MTTVIMISNDNSVIITNSDDSNMSNMSNMSGQVVKTPVKTKKSHRSPDVISSSTTGDSPVMTSKPVSSRKTYQARKLSVSTVDSDSEELNNSSSSTTSTLSSRSDFEQSESPSPHTHNLHCRTSGVSSGATSGSSATNLTYWRGKAPCNERKFTTLNRNQQKNKSNPVLRTRSFQVPQQQKLSAFTPSENSAFHCISSREGGGANHFQQGKFLTSTPVRSEARQRRAHQFRNCFNPPTLSAFQPGGDREHQCGPPDTEYFSLTRSLGRRGRLEREQSHHQAFRHLVPASGQHSLGRLKQRSDLSPINSNYTRIYNNETDGNMVSSDSDYDTIYSNKEDNNNLMPIGSVFPSGCHRHPSKIMVGRALLYSRPAPAQLVSYRNYSEHQQGHNMVNTWDRDTRQEKHHRFSQLVPSYQSYPSMSENSSESESLKRRDRPRLLPDIKNKCELGGKAKSVEGLSALAGLLNKTSLKDFKENNKSKISFNEAIVPRRQKLKISQPTNKFGGLSVSKAQILRRHTLHDKSHTSRPVHVHSWHKQDDEQQRSKSSSLKRSVSRRSSSSSRLSLLSRKEEVEISITDSQSLDRLSLHSQEELDDINMEKYLQTAGRAAGWAKDFDCLLSDKIGLSKFTEFLQKEFSHENIYFWCACERYRLVEQGEERLRLAQEIIHRHLDLGAVEPVNVDSVARAASRQRLSTCSVSSPPDRNMFLAAQRQIYNLMKFDSYPRFLKSDVYKDCIRAEMHGVAGGPEVSGGPSDDTDQGTVREEQLSQRRTDSLKTKRRKSMSFWEHWSKSREQLESEPCTAQSSDKGGCTLTRVIFPDKATTVVTTNTGESIRALISRLLEKRNLRLTSFDVFSTASQGGPLDLSEDCAILHCTEVKIEARVLFRLELPSHKSIGVKAKQTKTVSEVLAPILQQYGWNINEVDVYVDEDTTIAGAGDDKVDLGYNVAVIDNKRLFVVQKSSSDIEKAEKRNTSSAVDPEMTLYEGLQIMRKGRFEDQRGTEICFEIPEFLRLPENNNKT